MRFVFTTLCSGRFVRYLTVGTSTFLLDLALLFLITDLFHIPPVRAAGLSFLIAVSVNYLLSSRFVFTGTNRSRTKTYLSFVTLASVGLCLVLTLMYIATHVFAFNYIISRICIAGFVGVLNYLINLYINFQVESPIPKH